MLRSAVKDNLDALQRVAEQGLTGAQYTFGLLYDLAERLYAFARQGYTELFIVVVIAFIAFRVLVGFSRGFRGLRPGDTIIGRAYVTDGDGLMVSGYKIRMASLDAPEWDQMARHQDGYWFNHGKHVKSALIQAIGGKRVRVTVKGSDKYGRVLGSVTCRGKDVGEWLVRNGHAIAAYGNKYKYIEREAHSASRGMWGYAEGFDPRAWRHKKWRKIEGMNPRKVRSWRARPKRMRPRWFWRI